ncbi:hypothetical protein L6475_10805 [Prevotella sp. E9-3]|uniref:hypothetical protein n=1 Tax=Prevotella sp. E9-3 TaxID=2913621 RepID=UPI001EDB1336|nr:hypothetical protein [Prevotella sp. E9-3]UKK47700.1 hypothetical protein L6475_10805 [Prevotella sp. E9-3]
MKKSYNQPNICCFTVDVEDCIAASDPLHPTVSITTDENVDTSSKSRRQDIWDDEDENNY